MSSERSWQPLMSVLGLLTTAGSFRSETSGERKSPPA